MTSMTKKELATVAGYTYRRLHDIDQMLPKNQKLFVESQDNPGKYDLPLFVQHWVAYNQSIIEEENNSLQDIKAKHEAVKMEKSRIEVAKMKGEFVSINELAPLWTQIAATVSERFNNIPSKLAASLVMIADADIIEEAIEREIRDALSLMHDMPLPDGRSDGQKDDEAEEDGESEGRE